MVFCLKMDIMTQIILTFIIGVLASFIGAIVGSGGLISIPFLMFLGLPPQIAIATNKFGAVGLSIGSITKFKKEKKIIWKYILPFSILAIIGGIIGAKLLINIDEDYLSKIVGLILLILLPFIFLKKDLGIKNKKPSKQMKIIGSIIYFLLMIFGGFFGGGAGALIITTLIYFFGFKIIEANATDMVPWFILSLISLIIFMIYGIVNYFLGISLFIGMLVGGYLGAHIAVKKGDKWVKSLFVILVIISSIKIFFF